MTGLLSIIIALIVVGLILWLVGMLPIDSRIKQIIYVITIVFVIIWLLMNVVPRLGLPIL